MGAVMSKQTALQWYRQQMMAVLSTRDSETRHMTEGQIFTQALAMEREQIEEAYGDGINAHRVDFCNRNEYFEKTYGKEATNANG